MVRPRGRPKNSDIEVLIAQGLQDQSNIKCTVCNRIFARNKNLNAHFLTHYDEKKYECNFPQCHRSFKQSSQLKSHLHCHAQENPFKCPVDGCLVRQRHSNRNCNFHVGLKLIKKPEVAQEIRFKFYRNLENLSQAQINWFEEYISERERKLRNASMKKINDDIDGLQEIREEDKKKIHQEDIHQQQQVQQKNLICREEASIFWSFVNDIHEKGGNSKALFKKSCNSVTVKELCEVPMTDSENSCHDQ